MKYTPSCFWDNVGVRKNDPNNKIPKSTPQERTEFLSDRKGLNQKGTVLFKGKR